MKTMTGILTLLVGGCLSAGTTETDAPRAVDVTFESEGATLAGTLWLPVGDGPHPAMVYVHGSGRQTRRSATGVAAHFNALGVAVLGYDKRGVGASGGVYEGRDNASEENLTLLARDAGAGITFLRARADIDGAQVGLWGVSQAGWIVPIAAVLDGEVAFTVLVSGPTVTVGEEIFYSRLTGDDSGQRSTLTQEELSRLLREHGPSGFDPRPWLERMTMPGLWILGSADESIPIPETVAILDELIAGGQPFVYRVWDGADHGMRADGRLVPEYWAEQDDFVFGRAGVRAR